MNPKSLNLTYRYIGYTASFTGVVYAGDVTYCVELPKVYPKVDKRGSRVAPERDAIEIISNIETLMDMSFINVITRGEYSNYRSCLIYILATRYAGILSYKQIAKYMVMFGKQGNRLSKFNHTTIMYHKDKFYDLLAIESHCHWEIYNRMVAQIEEVLHIRLNLPKIITVLRPSKFK